MTKFILIQIKADCQITVRALNQVEDQGRSELMTMDNFLLCTIKGESVLPENVPQFVFLLWDI